MATREGKVAWWLKGLKLTFKKELELSHRQVLFHDFAVSLFNRSFYVGQFFNEGMMMVGGCGGWWFPSKPQIGWVCSLFEKAVPPRCKGENKSRPLREYDDDIVSSYNPLLLAFKLSLCFPGPLSCSFNGGCSGGVERMRGTKQGLNDGQIMNAQRNNRNVECILTSNNCIHSTIWA